MKFEKELITSYRDEIHLSHLVIEGTNEEIGHQLGCLARKLHDISKFSDVDRSIIQSQYDYLEANYPEHHARMMGFARAYFQA